MKKIRVAVVGTGAMAPLHVKGFRNVKECEIVSACDAIGGRAKAFAEKHGIPRFYESLKELLKDPKVDAITNVTSDRSHAPVSLAAIAAGKHVLCEKPLGINHAETQKMTRAANRKGVVNMVHFTYRNAPAIHMAKRLVNEGRLGKIIHVDACYFQSWLASKVWGDWRETPSMLWKLSKTHGGTGVLGDVGIHILDFASFPVGKIKSVHAKLKAFPEIKGKNLGEYLLDANDSALIQVEFENGALGTIQASRWATGYLNTLQLRIFGSEGGLRIDLDRAWDKLEICSGKDIDKAKWREVHCPKIPSLYQSFIHAIRMRRNGAEPDFQRGSDVQAVLDACFLSDLKRTPVVV